MSANALSSLDLSASHNSKALSVLLDAADAAQAKGDVAECMALINAVYAIADAGEEPVAIKQPTKFISLVFSQNLP